MARHWGDERPNNAELHDRVYLHGTTDPDRTDLEAEHDIGLEQADYLYEKGGQAYVERPSDMERRLHRDEAKARAGLHPHTGNVTVMPAATRCTCGRVETGYRHPGHLYRCPRYASHPEKTEAA